MFDLACDHQSLSELTDFELVLSHCFEKIGAVDARWQHAEIFKAALQYGRQSGYFNSRNLLTSFGQEFARIKQFDLEEAA